MSFETAQRLQKLPPYLFAELDRLRDEVRKKGVDIIDLGVGDPDQPTPGHIIARLAEAAQDPSTHRYPAYTGMSSFREVAAAWFKKRFGPELDPGSEVITLIGSKEGIAHFPFAFVNPGEVVLCPSPAYPVYANSTVLAGGEPVEMPLLRQNNFLPDLDAISAEALDRAKIIIINYPNNPTAAVADLGFYQRVVDFSRQHGLILISDAAYTELTFDDFVAPSVLEIPGAKEVAIEFHSLSKTFNMTGWRLGFAVGNADLVTGLGKIKSQIDSGAFDAVQLAGMAALEGNGESVRRMCDMYKGRRDVLVTGLKGLGLEMEMPKATFYVWCPCPQGMTSQDFCMKMLTECGVVTTPGNGLGSAGEGYVRMALTVGEERLKEAVDRLKGLGF
jgi:LL-diaminopimelate aminotransferase